MRVEFSVSLGGRPIVVSEDCESDSAMFEFIHHMQELFDNSTCSRNGETSSQVRVNVRTDGDENKYYEMVCFDPRKPECHYAKRKFGVNKKGGGLFPKNKDEEGNWKPWTRYNKETGKEE
jgi:hypothetical protein